MGSNASLFGVDPNQIVNAVTNGSVLTQSFVGTGGQTIFTLSSFLYTPNTNSLQVFINGQRQVGGRDFVETSTSTFRLLEGVIAGDFVDVIGFPQLNLTAVLAGSIIFPGGLDLVTYVNTFLWLSVKAYPFNAVGNGVVDDTLAIQAACDYLNGKGGGTVYLPPTGASYKISATINVPNGVVLRGAGTKNFAGMNVTNPQWTAAGSWINPTHAGTAVKLLGHGSDFIGVSFIHEQPVPTGGSWSPFIYGYCIEQVSSYSKIEDVMVVNASHGIYMNYTSGSGGGTAVSWKNVIISAYVERMRTTCVNDTISLSNIHFRSLWYAGDNRVVAYIRANTKGWRCGYTDNPMVDGMEFFEDANAFFFEDETCLGNTHSLYNGTLNNIQFNLPKICMKVQNSTTHVRANFGVVISQTGNAFGLTWADTAFQLNSDNVDINISLLKVTEAGGQLFDLGAGVGGKLNISNLTVDAYATVSSQVCFGVGAGASLRIGNYNIRKAIGNGNRFAGVGIENVITGASGSWQIYGRSGELTVNGNGSFQDCSTSCYLRPGQFGISQIRFFGEINVTAALAASTGAVRLANGIPNLSVSGINTATTGLKSFDTGWTDIAQADLDALGFIGNVQIQLAATVIATNGSIQVLYR